jgi:hypothetical protein
MREGGYTDGGPTIETTAVLQRSAHDGLLANAAVPYWNGTYNVLATDYGQTIDHDGDGCGDNYGANYDPLYDPTTGGPECAGNSLGIALLGAYYTPFIYVWKDGAVKYYQSSADNFGPWDAEIEPAEDPALCNDHWWKAFSINAAGAAPVYTAYGTPTDPECDDGATLGFLPYVGVPNNGDRIHLLNK